MFNLMAQGAAMLSQPDVIIALIAGTLGGMFIGAMPGLSASMAVALLIPVTFGMSGEAGITLLTAVYTSAIYGGSITACLLHTPGTPASAATAADGFALTKQGKGLKAIGVSTVASMIGGTISAIALLFIAPALSQVALKFSSLEYFLIGVFGLTIIGSLAGDNMMKGLLSGCLGLMIGCIGLDIQSSAPRYCFGILELQSGIQLVPAMIGLFSLSQVMFSIEDVAKGKHTVLDENAKNLTGSPVPTWKEFKPLIPTIAQSSIIGVLVGILPGAGGDIGSWISYNTAKNSSKHPEEFGKGNPEGIVATGGVWPRLPRRHCSERDGEQRCYRRRADPPAHPGYPRLGRCGDHAWRPDDQGPDPWLQALLRSHHRPDRVLHHSGLRAGQCPYGRCRPRYLQAGR